MTTTTTTFTVAASADDGRVSKATSSATIPTSGWGSPSNSGSSVTVGSQDNDSWPNYFSHYLGYFRFQNITIPQGATISSAYFKPYKSGYPSVPLVLHGINADNAAAPTAGSDLAASNFTSDNVSWTSSVGFGQQTSSDIKDIVQEIVDRSGWSSGNAIMLAIVTSTFSYAGQYRWNARTYDYSSGSEAAELVVEYESAASGETVTPDAAVIECEATRGAFEVRKQIGSTTSHGTSVPNSTSGSSPYVVGFASAVSGVSVGDTVTFEDYSMGMGEEYVYSVAAVNSTTSFDLNFVSGGSQGNVTPYGNLYAEDFSQAPGAFKTAYDYTSPRAWANDLDNSSVYSSGDDAVGEIKVNEKYDEGVVFSAGSSVALNSIKLTVDSSVRHNGTANSGAGFKYTAETSSGGGANLSQVIALQNVDNTTIEWIEFDGSGVTGSSYCDNFVTDNGTGRNNNTVRNCVMHNLTLQAGGFAAYAIHLTTSNDPARDNETNAILNNIIYGVTSTSGSGGDAGGIYADAGKSANPIYVYNNTVHNITPRTTAYFARGINVTEHAIVKNNIVSDVTGSSTANCFTAVGSFNSSNDYNLSTDTTAPGSNSVTSATLSDIYESDSGTVNLHLKSGSPAIDAGTDLGTTPSGVNIDIDGRNRDAEGDIWDIGADEYFVNGIEVSPAAAEFIAECIDPTVSEEYPSVSVTPVVAAFVAVAVTPAVTVSSIALTPVAASIDSAAIDPAVVVGYPSISVTPAVATTIVVGTFAGAGFTSVTVSPAAASFVADAVNPTASKDSFAYTPAVASFVSAGITPTVTTGSITITSGLASVAAAAVSPTTTLGSIAYTPATASFVAAGITPTLVFGSSTAAPGAAAIELTASYAGIELSSITVTPSVATFAAAAITPTVQLGSLSLGATASFEAEAQSPTSTYSSVTVPPADAAVLVESRFSGIIAGGVIVIPDLRATVVTAVNTPTVAYGSQTVSPLVSSFVSDANFLTVVKGNLTVSPTASIVEISGVSPTIDMGLDITPPVAASVYDVASFTLLVGKLSAYVGYTFSGLVDYEMDGLIDYDQIEPIDYQTTTSPTDYSTDGLLDYEYDN